MYLECEKKDLNIYKLLQKRDKVKEKKKCEEETQLDSMINPKSFSRGILGSIC